MIVLTKPADAGIISGIQSNGKEWAVTGRKDRRQRGQKKPREERRVKSCVLRKELLNCNTLLALILRHRSLPDLSSAYGRTPKSETTVDMVDTVDMIVAYFSSTALGCYSLCRLYNVGWQVKPGSARLLFYVLFQVFGPKPNSNQVKIRVLGFSANRVWLVSRLYIFFRLGPYRSYFIMLGCGVVNQ